jgi:hypothetical protein
MVYVPGFSPFLEATERGGASYPSMPFGMDFVDVPSNNITGGRAFVGALPVATSPTRRSVPTVDLRADIEARRLQAEAVLRAQAEAAQRAQAEAAQRAQAEAAQRAAAQRAQAEAAQREAVLRAQAEAAQREAAQRAQAEAAQRAETYVPSLQPTAPPIMTAPPVQPSTPAPVVPGISNPFPSIPAINPVFMGTGLGGAPTQQLLDLYTDPATGLMVNKPRSVELDETGRVVREITPEGSVPGVYFSDDRGMPATKGLGKDARFTPLDPNAVYAVVNERTGEVVSTGTGAEGMRAAQAATAQLSEAGRKADWAVVKTDPNTGQSSAAANVDPRQSPLGKFADVVLPAALAFTPLGPVGGAALGSGISSVAQGRSLTDTLLRAGISGAAAGVGAGVGGELGGALTKVAPPVGQVAASTAGQVGGQALGDIVVSRSLGALAGGALGTAAGAGLSGTLANMAPGRGADFADRTFEPAVQTPPPLDTATGSIIVRPTPAINPPPVAPASAGALSGFGGGSTLAQQPQQGPYRNEHGDLVLTGTSQPPGANIVSGALPGLTAGAPAYIPELVGNDILVQQNRRIEPVQEDPLSLPLPPPGLIPTTAYGTPAQNQSGPYRNEQGDLVLTGTTPPPVNPASAAGAAGAGLGYDTSGNLNEIVVQDRPNPPVNDPLAVPLPPIGSIPTTAYGTVGGLQTPQKPEGDGIFDNLDLVDYLRLAGLGIGTIGSLFEGGGRQTNGVIPGGLSGGLNSVFGGSLGAPTMPGAAGNFAPRPVNQDWMRYGYGPSQSFFNYVPQGQPNTSQAYTGYAEGGEVGGRSFAVDGPGTGRSDDIPALLSDGEYVIDAETVALLGDGSTEAGADRLDAFRVNIRKHKGAQLAKGGFSHDAKRPEQYLQGGLS